MIVLVLRVRKSTMVNDTVSLSLIPFPLVRVGARHSVVAAACELLLVLLYADESYDLRDLRGLRG